MSEPQQKKRKGCLFYGCLVSCVLFLCVVLAIFLGYRIAVHFLDEYTDSQPMEMPKVNWSDEETARLRERIAGFSQAVDSGRLVEPLKINTDEVNALIQTDTNLVALKGHFFVNLEESNVSAQFSLPCDRLGFRPLRGRYLNGTGEFVVSFTNGELFVSPENISAKGKQVPENLIRQLRIENFAETWNQKPNTKSALEKLQNVEVKDGVLTIIPKKGR